MRLEDDEISCRWSPQCLMGFCSQNQTKVSQVGHNWNWTKNDSSAVCTGGYAAQEHTYTKSQKKAQLLQYNITRYLML